MSSQPSSMKKTPLDELTADNITTEDLERLPYMTGWFEVMLLLKLLLRVIVSDLFGQYADRRLIEAALDPVSNSTHVERASADAFSADGEGNIWIDYVSDLGDGFDATYAIAYVLAQKTLSFGNHHLQRGILLIMGGDEVYPTAQGADYRLKMRLPYGLAWPVEKPEAKTPMYLLPGNHDWYDGLVNFLAIFCREKGKEIGGWKTRQRRSYFAVKISDDWWIWGIDIALVHDMDQPQSDYFEAIAGAMQEGASIILCSAEPGWYTAETKGASYRTLSYAALLAKRAGKNLRIPIILSGDSHHYARYEGEGSQYITSGGGGAFLHGTLELKDHIDAQWLQSPKEHLTLKSCYPSKNDSKKLLKNNLRFGAQNVGLPRVLATLYFLAAFLLTSSWRIDVAVGLLLVLFGGLWGYAAYQEKNFKKSVFPSALHTTAHFLAILLFSAAAYKADHYLGGVLSKYWPVWFLVLILFVVPLGTYISGLIFGANLWIACRFFDIGHNDAFSAMKLNTHRHFLRICINGKNATIYPIQLKDIPTRNEWQKDPNWKRPSTSPVIVPTNKLVPFLIEDPIAVTAFEGVLTTEIKPPLKSSPQ